MLFSIYFSIEFSFLIRYYSLLYQSLIPNCKLTINTLRQHISISDNIEQYIVGAASHRTSCQRLINFLLTRLYSEKDYMQFCYLLNIISVMTDLPYRLITGTLYVCVYAFVSIYTYGTDLMQCCTHKGYTRVCKGQHTCVWVAAYACSSRNSHLLLHG